MKLLTRHYNKICKIDAFGSKVYFVVCKPEHFFSAVNKLEKGAWGGPKIVPAPNVRGKCVYLNNGNAIIWMEKYSERILVHEVFHAVHSILKTKGVKFSDDSEEVYAYLIDYVYSDLKQ